MDDPHLSLCIPLIKIGMRAEASELYYKYGIHIMNSSTTNPIIQSHDAAISFHLAAMNQPEPHLKLEYYRHAKNCYEDCGDRESAKLCQEFINELDNKKNWLILPGMMCHYL